MILTVEILRVLDNCRGYMVPEHTLLNEVRLGVVPTPTVVEFGAALRELESKRAAVAARPELGGPLKWKITAEGQAALAEYNP